MADEPEEIVEPEVVVVPEPEPEPEPHPLSEEGVRFKEVYGRMKAAEEREREKDARLARLEGAMQARQPQQPVQYTPEQVAAYLQQQVDQGAITPMAAANALSQFNSQRIATATALQVEQARAQASKLQAASAEVNSYMDRVPALKDTNSADFIKVRDAAYSASDDMNLPVTDLRVQRRALREVYGSLEKMAKGSEEREASRRASMPHVETTTGTTRAAAPSKGDAWKKDIPAEHIKFWEKRGYTEEQMKSEAKYITRAPRKVTINK